MFTSTLTQLIYGLDVRNSVNYPKPQFINFLLHFADQKQNYYPDHYLQIFQSLHHAQFHASPQY